MKYTEFTVEGLIKAYEETGLKPIRGGFYVENQKCACALTALFIHNILDNDVEKFEKSFYKDNYFEEFKKAFSFEDNKNVWSFIDGFDENYFKNDNEPTLEFQVGNQLIKGLIEKGLIGGKKID